MRFRQNRSNECKASSGTIDCLSAHSTHKPTNVIYLPKRWPPEGNIDTCCAHTQLDYGEPTSLWLSLVEADSWYHKLTLPLSSTRFLCSY